MYSHRKAARRFSFVLNPGGIVIGYIFTLFATVVGMGAFPFSNVWVALPFVVVGAFFVVAFPVLVMVYLFFIWKFLNFARRLLFPIDQSQMTNKSSLQQKDQQP